MKISRLSVLTLAAVLGASLAFAAGVPQGEDPGVLLRAAIEQEEVNGDLEAAIGLYKKVIAGSGSEREVAAKALLRLGGCYEKLGREEAGRVYRQLIADYADQQPQVRLAQERLAVLTQKPTVGAKTDMAARRVWSGERVDTTGAVSPDGRYLSYTDWSSGDLAVRDLTTGESRRLTDKGPWSKSAEFAIVGIWSPDGTHIAYGWYTGDSTIQIRVIGLDGSGMRVVHMPRDPERYVEPVSWSRDGRQILAIVTNVQRVLGIGVVSVDDGSLRVLQELPPGFPVAAFSPDGRHVAYDTRQSADAMERDIFVIPAAGGQAAALVRHAADDSSPVWTPDGKWLLFVSNRTGTNDLWSVSVAGGAAQGEPRRVKSDIGGVIPLGVTREGSFFYGLRIGMEDVYTAAVDLSNGRVTTPPERVSKRLIGASQEPHWSPDGKQLAYTLEQSRAPTRDNELLCITSAETGDPRCLPLAGLPSLGPPRWSPDGRRLLVAADDGQGGNAGIRFVDPITREVTSVRVLASGPDTREWPGTWTPDGKGVLLTRANFSSKVMQLLRVDLATGEEKELYRAAFSTGGFARGPDKIVFSPDHRRLALVVRQEGAWSLSVMPADGGDLKVLVPFGPEQWAQTLAWTPDGRSILYSRPAGEGSKSGLFRVSAEGSEPAKLELEMDSIYYLGVHPDGKRIVFQSGTSSQEVWVLENFLPTLAATAGGSGT